MNRQFFLVALVIAALHVVVPARPAQSELVVTASRDPAVIKSQLRMARQMGDKTLKGFRAEPPDGTDPIAPETVRAAKDTYALIRAAMQGIQQAQVHQKYDDPVLAMVYKRIVEAWNLSRVSASKVTWQLPRGEFLDEGTRTLTRAMQLVDQALVLMP
jgi:hypothetical protein